MRRMISTATVLFLAVPAAATDGGFDAGLLISDYDYAEQVDGADVVMDGGTLFGISLGYTETLSRGLFLRIEADGMTGEVDYESDGDRLEGAQQSIGDVRLLGGVDVTAGRSTLTLMTGYGVRRLEDESGGLPTSSGLVGYDRTITYRYMPLAATLALPLGKRGTVELAGEYRLFLDGESDNDFSDVFEGAPDLSFDLDGGSGWRIAARAVVPLGNRHIAIGPFFERWDVYASEERTFSDPDEGDLTLFEPESRSERLGLSFALRF